MNAARGALQGAAAGLVLGALQGVAEAGFLAATGGAPDTLAFLYATVLYGLIGLGLGLGAGLVVGAALGRGPLKRLKHADDAFLFSTAGALAITPTSLFILRYLVNKVVFEERGVPMWGNLAILAAVGLLVGFLLTAFRALLRGPLAVLLKGPGALGAWGGLAVITAVVAAVGGATDPRDAFATGKPLPSTLADKPNVLYVMVDTLRADHLGAYGATTTRTPVLDAVAADGVVFEEAFAQASWTRASGATQLSGRMPSGHTAALKASLLPDDVVLWSEVMQQGGLATGALINNINMTATFNFDQGWDAFVYEAPDYVFGASESVFGLTLYKVIHKLHEKVVKTKVVTHFYQPAEVVLDDARAFIEANEDARWALFVHLMEPHDPYFEHPSLAGSGPDFNGKGFARAEHEHPDPALADYLKRVYADEVTWMDLKLAPFVDWLKAEGHYDDTLIVLTADHGEEFFEHGGWWHGTTLYDEQIHVPLILKLPGQRLAGTRVPWQVRSLDLAPTLTAALGLAPDGSWEGHDLIGGDKGVDAWLADLAAEEAARAAAEEAAMAGEAAEDDGSPAEAAESGTEAGDAAPEGSEEAAAAEVVDAAAPDPCAPYRLPFERVVLAEEDFEGNVLGAVRAGGMKFMTANAGNPRGLPEAMLFDVVADPLETSNLAGRTDAVCGTPASERQRALDDLLRAGLEAAKSGAVQGEVGEMSASERANLCALGYLSGADCE